MRNLIGGLVVTASIFALGCAHTPQTPGARADLQAEAQKTLSRMVANDPSLQPLLDNSVGYIVFPRVGEGGFIIGGGAGSGVVYENGRQTGFAEMSHAAVGALAGGQSFSQIVVVRDPQAMNDLKEGRFDFGAKAQAVILRSGASANATFEHGVAVIVQPLKGAMVNASLSGQRIRMVM